MLKKMTVVKRVYGTLEVEVPDDYDSMTRRQRTYAENKMIDNALANGKTPVWDKDDDGDIMGCGISM